MKKQILKDIVFMLIWWATLLAMSSCDFGETLFECFEALAEAIHPNCNSDITDQVAAIGYITASTALFSYAFNYVWNFFKKEFAK